MHVRPIQQAAALLLLLSCFMGVTHADSVPTYELTQLGSLSEAYSVAYGLNENGMIVGQSLNAATGKIEAVVWSGVGIQSLGFEGLARAVNNNGTVVGETGLAVSVQLPNGRAFMWNAGVYTDLGDLGGIYAGAYDVNDAGQITGFAFTPPGPTPAVQFAQAFLYENGAMTGLGTVSSPTGYSRGHGINEAGEVAGRASLVDFANSDKHMASWDAAGNISSNPSGVGSYSTAQQINNNGLIVGNGFAPGSSDRGLVWDAGVVTVMGTLGGNSSRALSVNDAGVIVGLSTDSAGAFAAMVSYDGQNLMMLSDLVADMQGWTSLGNAFDVNELGQIVGSGINADGQVEAFLLTPVPVPAAAWLFASAVGLLGWARRRRP